MMMKFLFDCTAITTWLIVITFSALYAFNVIYSEKPMLPKIQDRMQQSDLAVLA